MVPAAHNQPQGVFVTREHRFCVQAHAPKVLAPEHSTRRLASR